DNTARLWDLQGNQLKTFEHQDRVNSAQFSSDGNRILTTSGRTVKLWRVETLEEMLVRGCAWLEDYLQTNPNATEDDRAMCVEIRNSQKSGLTR
ncbi:MAG: hypothetical protein SWY16_25780, partial [Cyanobacteriota bacterium]|nr:hypothetical protein [Cyanobacteriota bacterium]